jgi:hypothetical protein
MKQGQFGRKKKKCLSGGSGGVEVRTCKVVEAAAVVAAPFVPDGDNIKDM